MGLREQGRDAYSNGHWIVWLEGVVSGRGIGIWTREWYRDEGVVSGRWSGIGTREWYRDEGVVSGRVRVSGRGSGTGTREWYLVEGLVSGRGSGIGTREWYWDEGVVLGRGSGIWTRDWYLDKGVVSGRGSGIGTNGVGEIRSSSDTRMLEIQQYKRKARGFRTLSCFGPHIWNSLPQNLRHCSTLSSFKAKLKIFLSSQYFHPNIST